MATVKSRRRPGSASGKRRSVKRKSDRSLIFTVAVIVLVVLLAVILIFIGGKKTKAPVSNVPETGNTKAVIGDDNLHRKLGGSEAKAFPRKAVKASVKKDAVNQVEKKKNTPEYGVKDRDYLDGIIKSR